MVISYDFKNSLFSFRTDDSFAIFLIIITQQSSSDEDNNKSVTSIVGVGYTAAVITIIYSLIHGFKTSYNLNN